MNSHLTAVEPLPPSDELEPDAGEEPPAHLRWVPPEASRRRRLRHAPTPGARRRFRRTRLTLRRARRALASDRGGVTAEYVIIILAAVAFAGLLVAIMRSDEVRSMLVDLVQNALSSAG